MGTTHHEVIDLADQANAIIARMLDYRILTSTHREELVRMERTLAYLADDMDHQMVNTTVN